MQQAQITDLLVKREKNYRRVGRGGMVISTIGGVTSTAIAGIVGITTWPALLAGGTIASLYAVGFGLYRHLAKKAKQELGRLEAQRNI